MAAFTQKEKSEIQVQAVIQVFKNLSKTKQSFLSNLSSIPASEIDDYARGYLDALDRVMEIVDHQSDAHLAGLDKPEDMIDCLLKNGYNKANIYPPVEMIQ